MSVHANLRHPNSPQFTCLLTCRTYTYPSRASGQRKGKPSVTHDLFHPEKPTAAPGRRVDHETIVLMTSLEGSASSSKLHRKHSKRGKVRERMERFRQRTCVEAHTDATHTTTCRHLRYDAGVWVDFCVQRSHELRHWSKVSWQVDDPDEFIL